jgi:hypothetical protein
MSAKRTSTTSIGCVFWIVVLVGLTIAYGTTGQNKPSGTAAAPVGATPFVAEPTETPNEPTPEPSRRVVDLVKALDEGLVTMTAYGLSIRQLSLGLTSATSGPITIVMKSGVVFKPARTAAQSVVAIRWQEIDLDPGERWHDWIDVACAQMKKDDPNSSDEFSISTRPLASDLKRLLEADAFYDASFRVEQFAIWTLTDNPARGRFSAIGSIGETGSGPSKAELTKIRALLVAAGIDADKYRAFR